VEGLLETSADLRADSLYVSAGFSSEDPPCFLDFALRLLGEDAVSFTGKRGARGAPVSLATRSGWHIYLHRGVSDAKNTLALANGVAQWDVARGGPVRDVEDLTRALALPARLMVALRAYDWSVERIAREMHLPLPFVEASELAHIRLESGSRYRVAPLVSTEASARAVAASEIVSGRR
jgi:hypothetical protein